MPEAPRLSLVEWIVLALIAEQPRHGFAIATLTAPDGAVGRAWNVPRPLVYRAIAVLSERGLVTVQGTESGRRGPQRSILAVNPDADAAVRRWLRTPVEHVRDARSELLVKLALTGRRGFNPGPLLRAQRRVFERVVARREAGPTDDPSDDDDFGPVLATWRLESARAALHFVEAVEAAQIRPKGRR